MKFLVFIAFLHFLLLATRSHSAHAIENSAAELRQRVHSHNDYQQKHPLYDALAEGLSSVEADIWNHYGEVLVSHMGFFFKGSLEELYLKPLQKRVDELGSVYGDGRPFILWLDIKENGLPLESEFSQILDKYPMLTEFTDSGVIQGAVTVILTGKAGPKTLYTDQAALRRACRDSKDFSEQDPPADTRWQWYSLEWSSWMKDPVRLASLTARIHAKGRKLRLWDMPESEAIWTEALDAHVDLIGMDDLPRARRFVDRLATDAERPR